MRANSKILQAQFRSKLKKILNEHPSQSVRISEFMNILAINYIRIYSKADIAKLYRYFENPLKISRIIIPLSYLNLECVQQCDQRRYFVAKVADLQVNTDLLEQKDNKHNVVKCLQTFIKIMKKLYGSQKNWFKALGGLTVAIMIEPHAFKRSVSKILCNTSHTNCAENITNLFLKQCHSNNIEWKPFMNVIYHHELLRAPIIDTKYNWTNTASNFSSVEISNSFFETEFNTKRNISYSEKHQRSIESAHSRPSIKVRKSIKSSVLPLHQQSDQKSSKKQLSVQFPRFFSLSAKPCILYTNKNEYLKTFATSFRPSTESTGGGRHRKTKTQPALLDQAVTKHAERKSTTTIKEDVLKTQTIQIPSNFLTQDPAVDQHKVNQSLQGQSKQLKLKQSEPNQSIQQKQM